MLLEKLNESLEQHFLLNHPFYQAWMQGALSLEDLRNYAVAYNPFIEEFPQYVSALHSRAPHTEARKILLAQLLEEEGQGFECDHPELWLRFAEGLGVSRGDVAQGARSAAIEKLRNFYKSKTQGSYAEGLGALLAYEAQNVEISLSKADGLIKNYQLSDERTLGFFKVHAQADEAHSQQCLRLVAELSTQEQEIAFKSCREAAKHLWDFLSEFKADVN